MPKYLGAGVARRSAATALVIGAIFTAEKAGFLKDFPNAAGGAPNSMR
jgi:hypothetical protein